MTKRSLTLPVMFAAASLMLSAESQPVKMLVSNGMKGAMEELQPLCEKAIGAPLAIQYSSTAGLRKRIDAGEQFDGTIITTEAIAALTRKGTLASGSRELGRSALGIGIQNGARKPDIRTVAAFKQALLDAKSITYPQDGATRGFIDNMFEKLGIAAQIQPKVILAPSSGASTENVATGKAEFVITLFSEIVPVKGIQALGALPGEYSTYVNFSIAAHAKTGQADAVQNLISFLSGQKAGAVLKAKGIELR